MGIGSVTSVNNISSMRMFTASSSESKNKSIQNEMINVQQQMQSLSTKEELSVNEKMNERKNLQKELASLDAELKRHQEELRRSQNREIMRRSYRKTANRPRKKRRRTNCKPMGHLRIMQTERTCLWMSSVQSSRGPSY